LNVLSIGQHAKSVTKIDPQTVILPPNLLISVTVWRPCPLKNPDFGRFLRKIFEFGYCFQVSSVVVKLKRMQAASYPTILIPAIEFSCPVCRQLITICRSCWRNQKYCSSPCVKTARLKRQRINRIRYRQTENGIKAHKAAQKRYRL